MSRSEELLQAAAVAFNEGSDPFGHEWLVEHQVTLDECDTLSETIGLAIQVYQEVMELGLGDSYPGKRMAAMILAGVIRKQTQADKEAEKAVHP